MAFGIPSPADIKELEDHLVDRIKTDLIPEIMDQFEARLRNLTVSISFGEKPLAPKP